MAELERLANHFGDIGAICNDASFALMHAHCGVLRERVLRVAGAAFGHRLMMDCDRPRRRRGRSRRRSGGERSARSSTKSASAFPRWSSSTTTPPRCRTAPSAPACSRADARPPIRAGRLCRPRLRAAPSTRAARSPIRPTTSSASTCRCSTEGDVNARVWISIREVEQSLALIEQILAQLAGRRRSTVDAAGRAPAKASALVEGFRGDVLVWLRLGEDGRDRALPSPRSVLVPVAAARGGDRGQHRRRLPALQQILQLLLFGPRPLTRHAQAPLPRHLSARR